jgi:hypothetical protein
VSSLPLLFVYLELLPTVNDFKKALLPRHRLANISELPKKSQQDQTGLLLFGLSGEGPGVGRQAATEPAADDRCAPAAQATTIGVPNPPGRVPPAPARRWKS